MGHEINVSIDRLKPAHTVDDGNDTSQRKDSHKSCQKNETNTNKSRQESQIYRTIPSRLHMTAPACHVLIKNIITGGGGG